LISFESKKIIGEIYKKKKDINQSENIIIKINRDVIK
jgi:hypothetical protein